MGQLIRPTILFSLGLRTLKVQENGQDRREGGWERDLDLRVVAVPGV